MDERKLELWKGRALGFLDERWRWVVFLAWLLLSAWFVYSRWAGIQGFVLGDTDDNMRMSQVRALVAGQDWFDLRQHRMNPPEGANIHWSRLVDLPLASLILLLRPMIGGVDAERTAIAVAPLLPYLILLVGLSLTTRRLVGRHAYLLAIATLFFAGSTTGQFQPTRIDHHGWQLAFLSLVVAGLADPKRARGGATAGLATALSLAIGLEMLIYLALAGAAVTLFWVHDGSERRRLAAYASSLAGGAAIAFLVFASNDNRLPVCDALSPVWLSNALLGGALAVGLAFLTPSAWKWRLLLALGAGVILAAFHALAWPQCLSRLEGVSPEVEELWLSHVREARPIYRHGWQTAAMILALPVTALFGWALLAWQRRGDRKQVGRVLAVAAPSVTALGLLFWQTRAGPAAQMLAIPGAIAIAWLLMPRALRARSMVVRVFGAAVVALIGVGAAAPLVLGSLVPDKKETTSGRAVAKANRLCPSLWGLRPIAKLPKGLIFTFVDLGPRVITVTHHDAIAGPYHRNGEQIADIMKTFRGSEAQARAIVAGKYRADYLMICPDMSTSTIFRAETPKGFYVALEKGKVPGWLEPIPLPKDSPLRIWRVKADEPAKATESSASARR